VTAGYCLQEREPQEREPQEREPQEREPQDLHGHYCKRSVTNTSPVNGQGRSIWTIHEVSATLM